MKIFSLRSGRRGSLKVRRRAAEIVIDELFAGTPSELGSSESAKLDGELTSMRSLAENLEALPGAAWSAELGVAAPVAAAAISGRPGPGARRSGSPRGRVWGSPGGRVWLSPRVSGTLAAAALVVAFVVGSLTHPFSGGGNPRPSSLLGAAHVVLKPLPGTSRTSLAVAYMPGGDHMLLHVRNLPRSAPGTYYELWLMTNDTHLVSVTSFRVGASGSGSLQLVLPDDPSNYKYLDISVQHLGGGIAISQDNVLRGAIPA